MSTAIVTVEVTLPDEFTQAELSAIFTTLAIPTTAVITRNKPPALPALIIKWEVTVTF